MLSDKCYTGSMHFVCESELGFFLVFHSKQIRMQGEVSASSRSDIDFTVVVSVYPPRVGNGRLRVRPTPSDCEL